MNKKTLTIVIVVIVVVVAVAVFVVAGNHGAPAQQNSQQPSAAPSPAAVYTSATDGFAVNFPGTPQVDTRTVTSPTAGAISTTEYTFISAAGGKGELYMVLVFHYPTTYQFSSNYLTGALQMFDTLINVKYPGTKVVSQGESPFLGGTAISGSVTVPFMGTPTPGNVLITTKNQNTYVVSAYGLSQSDYNAFLNSFTFTQ